MSDIRSHWRLARRNHNNNLPSLWHEPQPPFEEIIVSNVEEDDFQVPAPLAPQQNDISDWKWPDQAELKQRYERLEPSSPSYLAWSRLVNHDVYNKNAELEWYPFQNELCFMLWLGRSDPSLGMTRNMLTWIINLLLTLKMNNHIDNDYFIPTHATTVEKWWRFIPQPPSRMSKYYCYPCTRVFDVCLSICNYLIQIALHRMLFYQTYIMVHFRTLGEFSSN